MKMRYSLMLAFLLIVGQVVAAQVSDTLAMGETKTGAITNQTPAAFAYIASTIDPVTFRVLSLTPDFAPEVIISQSDRSVLETFRNADDVSVISGTFRPPAVGTYQIQIMGKEGGQGQFAITVDAMAEQPAQSLAFGQTVNGTVTADEPLQRYSLTGLASESILALTSEQEFHGLRVTLIDADTNQTIARFSSQFVGANIHLQADNRAYNIWIEHSGSMVDEQYTLSWTAPGQVQAVPSPTPFVATAAPPPSSNTAADPDILLQWDVTSFVATNVSGGFLNYITLRFQGQGIITDGTIWAQVTDVNMQSFRNEWCAVFRPGGVSGPGNVPPECNTPAAWYIADRVVFWQEGSFDVYYGGQFIKTCQPVPARCEIDLPST